MNGGSGVRYLRSMEGNTTVEKTGSRYDETLRKLREGLHNITSKKGNKEKNTNIVNNQNKRYSLRSTNV